MKILRYLLLTVIVDTLTVGLCFAADGVGVQTVVPARPSPPPSNEPEPGNRFDLAFKGGVPKDLVEAVEKAARTPVNAIIPEEHQDLVLPPLKLRNVTVSQLFNALELASTKSEDRWIGNGFQRATTSYGFKTLDQRPNANSIWYFYVNDLLRPQSRPATPPQCRFWQLEPYLEKLKVEDITTAIETGWKMLGVDPLPKLSFHKDTKLLIVVGRHEQLAIVDDVLRELTPGTKESKSASSRRAPSLPSQ